MRSISYFGWFIAIALWSPTVSAQTVNAAGEERTEAPPTEVAGAPANGNSKYDQDREDKEGDAGPLEGWGFGLSLGLTFDLGSNDRVREASLDPNGIVRVSDVENVTGRFLLETHHFWEIGSSGVGIGPFVAIEAGSDPIIQALGGGVMVGFKTSDGGKSSRKSSFNIGVGIIYDLNTQILGEGIVANEPLPEGETLIRFQETEQSGLMISSSFSFY